MKTTSRYGWVSAVVAAVALGATPNSLAVPPTLVGWNDLGMHCTDGSDFSIFSILPHYNTIHAQLMVNGRLVTSGTGYTVTYEAVADPDGSINKSSIGKGNFYQYVGALYGAALKPDQGLAGFAMPGAGNAPQTMRFDTSGSQFSAVGIPITPYDDGGLKNYYPMMRLKARNTAGKVIASTDIVLPVSDEMDCRVCHASGTVASARPVGGWWNDKNPARDFKLNILRLHDERQKGSSAFASALKTAGYNSAGLIASVNSGTPVLCAKCHASNALAGTGQAGVAPLTEAIHGYHAHVADPTSGLLLNNQANRAACYRCHPGSQTRCLRGAMGSAVAADGTMAMQCQSCHGTMSQVGAHGRVGWLAQPNCSSCHTGTAVSNNGQIRYDSVFQADGSVRKAVNTTFAASANTPAAGFALYRFSAGHGGLQCEACHGSTHAEFPSSHRNDNMQSQATQGHSGALVECSACHTTVPKTVNGGPHGMHPVGQAWVQAHPDAVEQGGTTACQACHGADYRGTVLSRVQGDRTLQAFGTKTFWRGFRVGCYNCHLGPGNDDANPNRAAVAQNATATTRVNTAVTLPLSATDPNKNSLVIRIVSQPQHGTVAFNGKQATYYPDAGFVGTDSFTFAAWDGSTDSNLGSGSIKVNAAAALAATLGAPVAGDTATGIVIAMRQGHVVVSWPSGMGVVTLEAADEPLPDADWVTVPGTPQTDGVRDYLEVEAPAGARFFRARLH